MKSKPRTRQDEKIAEVVHQIHWQAPEYVKFAFLPMEGEYLDGKKHPKKASWAVQVCRFVS